MRHVSGIFQCALTVSLALMVAYPTSAQPTDRSDQAFKFCMGQCTANSCSGPASVVEKNCTRKCMSAAPSSSASHDNR
ncbi:MAG: hypothetical protein EBW49_00205 [Betaproteobacteria bacterium]|nr:hypothetical protein [Betaproteobacteria bacterium]